MKRTLHSLVAAVAAFSVPAASFGAEMMTAVGPGEGEVDIVAWPGYIERGESDAAYDWVTQFEKDTGCKVNVKTAATSDEMVTLMNQGGFDLVTASGDASLRLVAGGKVQPVNVDLIKSWSTVDDRLKDAPWYTVAGVRYGVPYQWGPNVLMYNTDAFKDKPPTSWSVVFEEQILPDGKTNKGRVQAYDGPIYIADAATYLMAKKPDLGIKDPYELSEEQYGAVINLLKMQRQLIGRYWHDAMVQVDDFTNEGVVASSSWPFQVNLLKANGAHVEFRGAGGGRDGLGGHDDDACRRRASELRLYVDRALSRSEGAGRSRSVVRLGAGGAGGLQGQRASDRRRLRHQRLRQFRQDPLLADADRQVRDAGELRTLQPLGLRLHCRDGRALGRTDHRPDED